MPDCRLTVKWVIIMKLGKILAINIPLPFKLIAVQKKKQCFDKAVKLEKKKLNVSHSKIF